MQNQKIKVKVKIFNGEILEYKVSPKDTLQSLRTKLNEAVGIDEKDQLLGVSVRTLLLKMKNRSLLPHCTFEEVSVEDGDTLNLELRKGGYRLFVKTLDGQILELDADDGDTIWKIKELVQEQIGYPVEKQRVIYGGYELQDDKIVSDYGVQRDATFRIILRS